MTGIAKRMHQLLDKEMAKFAAKSAISTE